MWYNLHLVEFSNYVPQGTRGALADEISSAIQDLVDTVSWLFDDEEEEEEADNMAANIMEVRSL